MSSPRPSTAGTRDPVAGERKPPALPRPYRSAPTSPEKGAAAAVGGYMSSLSTHRPDVAPPGPAGNRDDDDEEDELIVAEMTGVGAPAPMDGFDDDEVGLPAVVLKNVGFKVPTLLQTFTIPVVMAGRDLLVVTAPSAKTTGKSAAFCLSVVSGLLRDGGGTRARACKLPRAVILAPTAQRAAQIHKEAKKCSYNTHLRVEMVISGSTKFFVSQLRDLRKGVDILVATPGPLILDILKSSTISLDSPLYFIVDEIDRMVDMGLEPMIRQLSKLCMPQKRHSTIFSATLLSAEIQMLASDLLSDHVFINIGRVLPSAEKVTQKIVFLSNCEKELYLRHMLADQSVGLDMEQPSTLIFVDSTLEADSLSCWLSNDGFSATCFHGDKTKEERENALQLFKFGLSSILVASDAASWGLNVENIAHVINYDLPKKIESYFHRIRKAGKFGLVTSFFSESDQFLAKDLVKLMHGMKQDVPDLLLQYTHDLHSREIDPYYDYLVEKFMAAISVDVKANSDDIDYKAIHQRQTNEYANSAVLHHNCEGENKVKYELVQAITSCGINDLKGLYVHVNFTAMNTETLKVDLFFAELRWDSDNNACIPTCVVMLEENQRVGGLRGTDGCAYKDGMNIRVDLQHCYACETDLKHPMNGELYEIGHKAMSECYGYDP